MSDWTSLLSYSIEKPQEPFVGIVGESPSKGAKSPLLWNAAYAALGKSTRMIPLDSTPGNLGAIVEGLKKDPLYRGGAVTMPYKSDLVDYLDELEDEAAAIGAINCIYRRGENLVGANTDGAGAVRSLKRRGDWQGKTALVIGLGGAGLAVATFVGFELGKSGKLIVSNRTRSKSEALAEKLSPRTQTEVCEWTDIDARLSEVDLLVNCTNLGFEHSQAGAFVSPWTPLAGGGSGIRAASKQEAFAAEDVAIQRHWKQVSEQLARLRLNTLVYDIIYQPVTTPLLFLAGQIGRKTLGGSEMNLEQAIIGFEKANAQFAGRTEIAEAMKKVW